MSLCDWVEKWRQGNFRLVNQFMLSQTGVAAFGNKLYYISLVGESATLQGLLMYELTTEQYLLHSLEISNERLQKESELKKLLEYLVERVYLRH